MNGNKELNELVGKMVEQKLTRAVRGQLRNGVPNISEQDIERARKAFHEYTNPETLRGVIVITINDAADPDKGMGISADVVALGTGELMECAAQLLNVKIADLVAGNLPKGEVCEGCGLNHDDPFGLAGGTPSGDDLLAKMFGNIRPMGDRSESVDALLAAILLGPLNRRR